MTILELCHLFDFMGDIQMQTYYKRYYPEYDILFHTGLRISKLLGLTIDDANLEENYIRVSHSFVTDKGDTGDSDVFREFQK